MVTADELAARAELIRESADLSGLLRRIRTRSSRLLSETPVIPGVKALLSRDGGVCPEDGAALRFDPWEPESHACTRCGRRFSGVRHHRHWARFQHLWVAEQAAELATIGTLGDDPDAIRAATQLLLGYAHYTSLPNSDNVLGPSRLFFSTYLDSIWITNYLGAAALLREAGLLDDAAADTVSAVADEAAALIGEFNEGFSNRQTWHNAALAAVAVWFEDEELAARAIESESGLLAHLAHGFAPDGTWHEGENYHLFALQGLLTGIRWARSAGVDALGDPELAARIAAALRAPTLTALPDLTFPARKDSRFGVSLAQPMYLELWERGLGTVAGQEVGHAELSGWLNALYAAPPPPAQTFDSWLYEAGETAPENRSRSDLSWNALLDMLPELPAMEPVPAASVLLPSEGLVVFRRGDRYISLECGEWTGGHGHPDRLHLTIHASGVHWLPDFGTGSYVTRDLFWYRSTLAHNAPRLDGTSQEPEDATCEAFHAGDDWSWARGKYGPVVRSIVAGPDYALDIVELNAQEETLLELPWHLDGADVLTPGQWSDAAIAGEHVTDVAAFQPEAPGPVVARAIQGQQVLTLTFAAGATVLRGSSPAAPGDVDRRTFLLLQARGTGLQLVTAIGFGDGSVRGLRVAGSAIEVDTADGTDVHAATSEGWDVRTGGHHHRLGGLMIAPPDFEPLVTRKRPLREHADATFATEPPALDGSLAGFERGGTLHFDHEDQYRRSEEPFAGPEAFGATAHVAWDHDALYLAVEVTKPEVVLRPADAPPLLFDNEVDDIHSDGVQVYLKAGGDKEWGVLVVPEAHGGVRVRAVSGTSADPSEVDGVWSRTESGYTLTLALAPAFWDEVLRARTLDFDLIVNEMREGRERRAGQLVWSGGGGWIWLRGDRQDPERFGRLDLV